MFRCIAFQITSLLLLDALLRSGQADQLTHRWRDGHTNLQAEGRTDKQKDQEMDYFKDKLECMDYFKDKPECI